MQNKNNQRGVALLITLIISAIMLVSVTAFSREMVDEIRSATRLDNSMIAYYAAEAGLEEALLEWRDAVSNNSETEISAENDANASVDVISPDVDFSGNRNNTPRCVNLDTGQKTPAATCQTNRNASTRYYGVRMWYKQPSITGVTVKKDEVYEFEVPNMTQDILLEWEKSPNTPSDSGYSVEIITLDADGHINPAGRDFTNPRDLRKNINRTQVINSQSVSGKKTIRIKPWYTKLNIINGQRTEGTPFGQIPSITNLSVNAGATNTIIGSPTTTIESTGYYGGVARKITATLDRTSGNIISIFDNSIYSESELVK